MSGDQRAEAERLQVAGTEVIAELREAHKKGDLARCDELGKQAMGIWAQAQLAATLYLANQQRVANLIAQQAMIIPPKDSGAGISSAEFAEAERLETAIREGLGLS